MIKDSLKAMGDISRAILEPSKTPVYYHDINNFGDQLTPYLLEKILGNRVRLVRSDRFARILGVGSILHFSSPKSYIWGGGLIAEKSINLTRMNLKKIIALRGSLTKKVIENASGISLNCILGDPGVLLPIFYNPRVDKVWKIGIVPHYVDLSIVLAMEGAGKNENVVVIDVRDDVESVAAKICSCDIIVSSSLHGLVLSDAYGIPNVWVAFSQSIIGGDFKYRDYFSTTSNPERKCFQVGSHGDYCELLDSVDTLTKSAEYLYEKSRLIDSLRDLKIV